MKKLFLLLATLSVLETSFAQKATKATRQKTFAGMGGVFMNYVIEFKNKNADTIIIDSLKTIADTSEIRFASMKTQSGVYQLSFGYALSKPEKCKTCPDVIAKQSNLTKGVIVYHRKGEKKSSFKVKKFKLLPDLRTP